MTLDIFGLDGSTSSGSAGLQLSLENRLRALLDVDGSPEYELTWKGWGMPSGPPICALRASHRPICASGYSGWPTPKTRTGGPELAERKQELGRSRSGGSDLEAVALLSGWQTPSSRDWKDTGGMALEGVNPDGSHRERLDQLGRQVRLSGATTLEQAAGRRGVLNPAFVRWLMGYPAAWDGCADTATRLCRRSGPSS